MMVLVEGKKKTLDTLCILLKLIYFFPLYFTILYQRSATPYHQ